MNLFSKEQLSEAWSDLPKEIRSTPLVQARTKGLYLKLESLQLTGSYKIRAAFTRLKVIASLEKNKKGRKPAVALSSSGNFASAFTWAADLFNMEAHLVVTSSVNPVKISLAQQKPCLVHTCGQSYESRFQMLKSLTEQGIESIDHRTDQVVFLGHSTIGWECLDSSESFDRVLIPVSTGGLAIGVASALREGGFKGEILGIQPSGNPTLFESWQQGFPRPSKASNTICDALTATSIPEETFFLLKGLLDDILMVEEESVLRAVGFLALDEGLVVEPGAAVGIAALLEGQRPWKRTLCILTGRNLDSGMLNRCLKAWANLEKERAMISAP